MKVVIVDDEITSVQHLKSQLENYPDMEIAATFTDSVEALSYLIRTPCDLLFLDIEMPNISGLYIAEQITLLHPGVKICFITAHAEGALKAFELNALDYIPKPFTKERLEQCLSRIRRDVERLSHVRDAEQNLNYGRRASDREQNINYGRRASDREKDLNYGRRASDREKDLSHKRREADEEHVNFDALGQGLDYALNIICGYHDEDVVLINTQDIYYFETVQSAVFIHTKTQVYRGNKPLSFYEEKLRPLYFFKTHKCFLVNLSKVDRFSPRINYTYDLFFKDLKDRIPLSRNNVKALKSYLH